jgi:GH25 family lysozyme M1 (1,4-beta-N-acetylmuramidase)
MTQIYGIDVSSYQGIIDWPSVKLAEFSLRAGGKATVDFAICKATDGQKGVDQVWDSASKKVVWTFKDNWQGARAAGLVTWAYHFAHPDCDKDDARIEAKHFVTTVLAACDDGILPDDAVLCLDIEEARNVQKGKQFTNWVLDFCDEIEVLTKTLPCIYSGGPFFDDHDGEPDAETVRRLQRYVFWLSAYVNNPEKYVGMTVWKQIGWTLWQKSGDVAAPGEVPLRVSGIRTVVDCNVFRGSIDDLRVIAASCRLGRAITEPAPDAEAIPPTMPPAWSPQTSVTTATDGLVPDIPEYKEDT